MRRRYEVTYTKLTSKKRKFDGTMVVFEPSGSAASRVRISLLSEDGAEIDADTALPQSVEPGKEITLQLHAVVCGDLLESNAGTDAASDDAPQSAPPVGASRVVRRFVAPRAPASTHPCESSNACSRQCHPSKPYDSHEDHLMAADAGPPQRAPCMQRTMHSHMRSTNAPFRSTAQGSGAVNSSSFGASLSNQRHPPVQRSPAQLLAMLRGCSASSVSDSTSLASASIPPRSTPEPAPTVDANGHSAIQHPGTDRSVAAAPTAAACTAVVAPDNTAPASTHASEPAPVTAAAAASTSSCNNSRSQQNNRRGFVPPRPSGGPGTHAKVGTESAQMRSVSAPAANRACGRRDVSECSGANGGPLRFPLAQVSSSNSAPAVAPQPLAVQYANLATYQLAMRGAVYEQVNSQLAELAQRLRDVIHLRTPQQRAAGVGYYPSAELIVSRSRGNGTSVGNKASKRSREESEHDEEAGRRRAEADASDDERKIFLKLDDPREASSVYGVDDLWLVAGSEEALAAPTFMRALWHGPGSSGMLEVGVLQEGLTPVRASRRVVALRGPNASDLLAQLDMLDGLALPRSPPILNFLLSPARAPPSPPLALTYSRRESPDLSAILQKTLSRFRLNEEQTVVLRRVFDWLQVEHQPELPGTSHPSLVATSPASPALLVHGVFGAGKSHLLVAILWFLQRALHGARTRGGRPARVLLAALTNVAVDNVISGLIAQSEEGEEADVVRVGSLRRIAPSVLPHSTHGKLAKDDEAATRRELERDARTAPASEQRVLREAISMIDSGRMVSRARAIGKYTVVGATVAATGLACMAGQHFDIVLLDECSQLTEPASMLPLTRHSCERLLAVGDPMQLPPTLHGRPTSQHGVPSPQAEEATTRLSHPCTYDLTLTLFERLAQCGVAPVLLRAQYRCHPRISSLASRLFYRSSLVDGLGDAAARARAPLLAGLPTVGFIHVVGSESVDRGGSIVNTTEASRVARVIGSLLGYGLEASQIGCVCLYRAQATLCRDLLAKAGLGEAGTSVATVDSFQGAERDVILVSASRTDRNGSLAFIFNRQRLNVTITRARHHLLIICNATTLQELPGWSSILNEAEPVPARFASGHGDDAAARYDPTDHADARDDAFCGADGADVACTDTACRERNAHTLTSCNDNACVSSSRDGSEQHLADKKIQQSAAAAAEVVDVQQTGIRHVLQPQGSDDLLELLDARRRKKSEIEAMAARIEAEMAERMDTGVRVNPMLARMYKAPQLPQADGGCVDSTSDSSGGDELALDTGSVTLQSSSAQPPVVQPTRRIIDLLAAGSSDESSDDESAIRSAAQVVAPGDTIVAQATASSQESTGFDDDAEQQKALELLRW